MANSKISALTSATTPLAGTETLPVVQSSATTKVAVSNLTAGRAVSGASFAVTGSALPAIGIYSPAANTLGFATASTIRSVVYSAGLSVGNISTISDFSGMVMQVYADSGSAARIKLVTATSGTTSGDGASITFDTSNLLQFLNRELGDISFGTSAVERARLSGTTTNFTLTSGNFVLGTAAKGINFTANTPAAGMTSQLLNWYEEGTWTPNQGAGLTLVGAFSSTGRYTRIGRQVSISGTVTGATTVALAAAGVITSNLPFTVVTAGHGDATNVAVNTSATVICTGTSVTSAAAIGATATITFSATYFV